MSDPYSQLLEATIRHLETLKGHGVRHVRVSAETLAALSAPVAAPEIKPAAGSRAIGAPAIAGGLGASTRGSQDAKALHDPPRQSSGFSRSDGDRPLPGPPEGGTLTGFRASEQVHKEPGAFQSPGGSGSESAPASPPPADKEAAMAELRSRALVCTRCPHLVKSRRQVVFGVGDVNATLMFVGEAPGADEDAQGEPFVGAAGQLLTRIIQTMGLSRETVYIANILKCRPDTPGRASGNRPPTEEEMETCFPYLLEQIDIIRPKVIVALGATAVKGLLHSKVGITKLRGQWQVFRGIPAMPTYHPAYLLRNQALSEKRKVWEDMLKVLEKIGLPITDKQRGYFLKSGS